MRNCVMDVLRASQLLGRFGRRGYSSCEASNLKGLVLGAYDGCNPGEFILTPTAERFDEQGTGGLKGLLKGTELKLGKAIVLSNLSPEYKAVAVAGLGSKEAGMDDLEILDECKENTRKAAGAGARALQDVGMTTIFVEEFTSAECAAEGSVLGLWRYQDFKTENRAPTAKSDLYEGGDREGWNRGKIKAEAQNVARALEEAPSNHMTPTKFAQRAMDILCPCSISVFVRDKDFLEMNGMKTILSVGKSSCEQPLMLELNYCAANMDEKPIVFVGKGVTFDSGGIAVRHCKGMDSFRADMAGAAVLVGLFKAVAQMNLPINITGFIPLAENMTGGMSLKHGDVLLGMNGKTISVTDPSHEGRILLADPLVYSERIHPCLVMTIGTLSSLVKGGLGTGPSPVWTESHVVWRELSRAGAETGDRVWRLPMWKYFAQRITGDLSADVNNCCQGIGGDPSLSAAFLKEFAPLNTDFVHIDIFGTGMEAEAVGYPYLRPGVMTGRPVRTLAQFLYQMVCPHEKGDEC